MAPTRRVAPSPSGSTWRAPGGPNRSSEVRIGPRRSCRPKSAGRRRNTARRGERERTRMRPLSSLFDHLFAACTHWLQLRTGLLVEPHRLDPRRQAEPLEAGGAGAPAPSALCGWAPAPSPRSVRADPFWPMPHPRRPAVWLIATAIGPHRRSTRCLARRRNHPISRSGHRVWAPGDGSTVTVTLPI